MPKGKRKAVAPKDETSQQKLMRLGQSRVNKILNAHRQIGNLARLKPSPEQTEQVFGALKKSLNVAYEKWQGVKEADQDFTMPA